VGFEGRLAKQGVYDGELALRMLVNPASIVGINWVSEAFSKLSMLTTA